MNLVWERHRMCSSPRLLLLFSQIIQDIQEFNCELIKGLL
jgi:hypothetical protein